MNDFKKMYDRLEELMLNKLPECIVKWNKENADFYKFELKPFTNGYMDPGTNKVPYFVMTFKEAEQAKKDRIINTINYRFDFEFYYEKDNVTDFKKTLLYEHVIEEILKEDNFEYWQNIEIPKLTAKKFELLVHVEW